MASGSGSPFSQDQLALAKSLQSGYLSSGTFHTQGQGGPAKSASSQQTPRKPHAVQPVRSQPPPPRSTSGLVRPLPSNASTIRPAATDTAPAPKMVPAARPASAVQSAPTARPAPPHPTGQSSSRPAPAPAPATPPHARTQSTLPVARSVTQPPTSSAPPVQPMPSNNQNQTYNKPPPMPTNLQPALIPTPLHPAAKPAHSESSSLSVARPSPQKSHSSQLLKGALSSLSLATALIPSTGRENIPAPTKHRNDAVSRAVMQGIKINQMGKPIMWNWTTDEPVARELTQDEIEHIEQMRRSEALAPGLEGKATAAPESPPRKTVGLKGSRHAQ